MVIGRMCNSHQILSLDRVFNEFIQIDTEICGRSGFGCPDLILYPNCLYHFLLLLNVLCTYLLVLLFIYLFIFSHTLG